MSTIFPRANVTVNNMLRFSRVSIMSSRIFKPLSEVCLVCRTGQVVWRRTFLKRASKEQKEEEKMKRKQERRELVGEITKGYFSDLREFGESGGKRFFASEKLIDQEAVSFPELNARNLHKRNIKLNDEFGDSVTLVLMWLRAIGQNMCQKYREPFMEIFQQHPHVKCYEVNVIDGMFFKLMKPFIENSLKQQISLEKQDRYLCYYGNTKFIKDRLIENEIVGHVFLVDSVGKIRWKAHGRPTEEEIRFMINCTEKLLKENNKSLKQKYQR